MATLEDLMDSERTSEVVVVPLLESDLAKDMRCALQELADAGIAE